MADCQPIDPLVPPPVAGNLRIPEHDMANLRNLKDTTLSQ
jgi:hypothetical protein